ANLLFQPAGRGAARLRASVGVVTLFYDQPTNTEIRRPCAGQPRFLSYSSCGCTANSEFVALQFALAIMRQTNQLPILNRLPLLTIWFCCTLRLDTKRIMHPSISDR